MFQSRVSESWLIPNMESNCLQCTLYPCSFVSKTISLVLTSNSRETRWFHVFPDIQEFVDLRVLPFRLVCAFLLVVPIPETLSLFFFFFFPFFASASRWVGTSLECFHAIASLVFRDTININTANRHPSLERLISCLVDVRATSVSLHRL